MAQQPEELEKPAGPSFSVENPPTRRVRPVLTLLAGLLEFGLGYVYVGQLHRALASIAIFYAVIGFFAWTKGSMSDRWPRHTDLMAPSPKEPAMELGSF
jgi:hypothetical protein